MTDQIFYEELRATVRDAIASYLDTYTDEELRELATESLNLPSHPTLADMTPEERAACQWMQADVANRRVRYVIANPLDEDDEVALIDHDGDICWLSPGLITPRPDLPRMEWPGNQKSAPALPGWWRLADHKEYGRVMVTSPAPDRDGDLWGFRSDDTREGADRIWCKPDELTYIDGDQ